MRDESKGRRVEEARPPRDAWGGRVGRSHHTEGERIARQNRRVLCAPDGTVQGHVVMDRWGNVHGIELRTD